MNGAPTGPSLARCALATLTLAAIGCDSQSAEVRDPESTPEPVAQPAAESPESSEPDEATESDDPIDELLNSSIGACPSGAPLDPMLVCGSAGEGPSFVRGVDCWLGRCQGDLRAVPHDAVWLEDENGDRVASRVRMTPPVTVHVDADAPLQAGSRYALVLRVADIDNSAGDHPTVVNGRAEDDGTFRFCFDPGEDAAVRNGNGPGDHQCD